MLGFVFVAVLTSGIFTRPTWAEFLNPAATVVTTTVTPIITSPAILGATTDTPNGTGAADVKGTTDDKTAVAVNSDANQGKIFGIAWYWWILILAALVAIAWFIIAAVRRRNEEQA